MKELSLHILDLAQNSVKAGAAHIAILLERAGGVLAVTIADDGAGMSPAFAAAAADPFTTTRTTRKVGMGLPLTKLAAEQTGGSFSIESRLDAGDATPHGTRVRAEFHTDHVDCAPLGAMGETLAALVQGSPERSIRLTVRSGAGERSLDTDEMRAVLGDVPLDTPEVLAWIQESVDEMIFEAGETGLQPENNADPA